MPTSLRRSLHARQYAAARTSSNEIPAIVGPLLDNVIPSENNSYSVAYRSTNEGKDITKTENLAYR
jgi:hypothetical protein